MVWVDELGRNTYVHIYVCTYILHMYIRMYTYIRGGAGVGGASGSSSAYSPAHDWAVRLFTGIVMLLLRSAAAHALHVLTSSGHCSESLHRGLLLQTTPGWSFLQCCSCVRVPECTWCVCVFVCVCVCFMYKLHV